MENKHASTPYDDAFKTLLNDCTRLIIPVVNEIFGENYTGQEFIQPVPNEHFIQQPDNSTKEKITDSCFTIHGTVNKTYHIECQSTPDGTMAIRMFEYDSQIALDNKHIQNHILTVSFPESAILYLRHTLNTPNAVTIRINTPGGQISYRIPVMKIQNYTITEIFEKNLLFLIPFFIFSYEKEFEEYNTNGHKLQTLEYEYAKIRKTLNSLCDNRQLSEYEKRTIIDLSKMVLDHLAARYDNIREGVKNAMGGKILDYEAKDILNKGINEGIRIGEKNAALKRIQDFCDLVRDGILSTPEAAKRLDMTESEFKKYL